MRMRMRMRRRFCVVVVVAAAADLCWQYSHGHCLIDYDVWLVYYCVDSCHSLPLPLPLRFGLADLCLYLILFCCVFLIKTKEENDLKMCCYAMKVGNRRCLIYFVFLSDVLLLLLLLEFTKITFPEEFVFVVDAAAAAFVFVFVLVGVVVLGFGVAAPLLLVVNAFDEADAK
jgi:hypothetical protein